MKINLKCIQKISLNCRELSELIQTFIRRKRSQKNIWGKRGENRSHHKMRDVVGELARSIVTRGVKHGPGSDPDGRGSSLATRTHWDVIETRLGSPRELFPMEIECNWGQHLVYFYYFPVWFSFWARTRNRIRGLRGTGLRCFTYRDSMWTTASKRLYFSR